MRFDLMIYQTLRVSETMFHELEAGYISDEIWRAHWRAELAIPKTPGARKSWERQVAFVSRTFSEWVNAQIGYIG